MLWIIYAGALTALYAAASWWALGIRRMDWRNWAGVSLLGLWLAGVGATFLFRSGAYEGSANPADTVSSVAWPGPPSSADVSGAADPVGIMPPHATTVSARSGKPVVGSVESLIGPLKARLAKHPQDPNGWALLAQSYAYVGNEDGAKRAIARAVALGADGQALRARVAAVGRSRAHSNWIADAIDK